MPATRYGLGTWGLISEASNGLYIDELAFEASEEEAYLPNHIGEDIGLSLFNQSARVSGNGGVVTAETQGQTLGGVLSIAGEAIFGTDCGITKFYVNGVGLKRANKDWQMGNFSAVGRLGISDATGTEVS